MKFVNFSMFAVLAVLLFVSSVQSLDQKDCKCKPNNWKKIANGKPPVEASRPVWLASIHSKLTVNKNLTVCAATILNEQWLLTAATCVPNPANESIEEMKIQISKDKHWLDVEEVLLHPEYERTDLFEAKNDIALVRVQQKIRFDDLNEPACLDDQKRSMYTGQLNFAVYGSKTPVMVRTEKNKRIVDFKPSSHLVQGGGFDEVEKSPSDCKDPLCVGSRNPATSVCLSDLGTPIHWAQGKKEFVVAVATIPRPEFKFWNNVRLCINEVRATRVHLYLNWIKKVLQNEICH